MHSNEYPDLCPLPLISFSTDISSLSCVFSLSLKVLGSTAVWFDTNTAELYPRRLHKHLRHWFALLCFNCINHHSSFLPVSFKIKHISENLYFYNLLFLEVHLNWKLSVGMRFSSLNYSHIIKFKYKLFQLLLHSYTKLKRRIKLFKLIQVLSL